MNKAKSEQIVQKAAIDLDQNQEINKWKDDISKLQCELIKKLQPNKFNLVISKSSQVYASGYISNQQLQLVDSTLEVRYPTVPKQRIIEEMYSFYEEKKKLSQETDFIVEYIKQVMPDFDTIEVIDGLHQYFSVQGSIPRGNFQKNIAENSEYTRVKQNKKSKKSQPQFINDFYDSACQDDEDVDYFQGRIIQNGIKKIKSLRNYLNQKKIVHVFTKKGYGVDKYLQYLQKRKLDNKQWQFYQQQLIKRNNYTVYLSGAIHETLKIIMQYLGNLKHHKLRRYPFSKAIKDQQFNLILTSIYQLGQPANKYLNQCMRVLFELKIDAKIGYEKVHQLFYAITKIRKNVQGLLKVRLEFKDNLDQDDQDL